MFVKSIIFFPLVSRQRDNLKGKRSGGAYMCGGRSWFLATTVRVIRVSHSICDVVHVARVSFKGGWGGGWGCGKLP